MEIISRIINRIRKEQINRSRKNTPFHPETTYLEKGNQWYDPVIIDTNTFLKDCSDYKTLVEVSNILDKLSEDDYLKFLKGFYKAGINNIGKNWKYAENLSK